MKITKIGEKKRGNAYFTPKIEFFTKKLQKIQFKIERNFKSLKFARIRDFHTRLWGHTSFLGTKTKGNENFDITLQTKA